MLFGDSISRLIGKRRYIIDYALNDWMIGRRLENWRLRDNWRLETE